MRIRLNGESFECRDGATLHELIVLRGLAPERVGAELNGALARRADFSSTALAEGDRVELVHFVGGG